MKAVVDRFVFGRSRMEVLAMLAPAILILIATVWFAFHFVNPAPPSHLVIATGDGEGDYAAYANKYHDIMAKEGIDLVIRTTKGAMENVQLINDPKSDVQVAFVHDGIVKQEDAPDVLSLGSMYYEPLWVFVNTLNGNSSMTRLSEMKGKTINIGEAGSGTEALALRVLAESGVTKENSNFKSMEWKQLGSQLESGKIDVAFFIGPPEDELIESMLENPRVRLMNMDNAEAMQRKLPFLHHLSLPHGSINLAKNLPAQDIEMVAPTATLLVKKSIHPALVNLLLKAATTVHSDAGVFEKANEFPSDKDYEIDLNEDARHFYKNGVPAWQHYLPFWLATLLERLFVVAIPLFAVVLPALKSIPRFFNWQARSKIIKRYADLKFIEMQVQNEHSHEKIQECLEELKVIENKVNHLRVPLAFADQVYGLRSYIIMVQDQISKAKAELTAP